MKCTVEVLEVFSTEITVEADNQKEAIEKVFNGEGQYGASDYQYTLEEGRVVVRSSLPDGSFVKSTFIRDSNDWKLIKEEVIN